jgi:exosortase/archaeosortase family protein
MSHFTQLPQEAVPSRLAAPLNRRELFVWLASILFFNQAIQLLDFSSYVTFAESLAFQNYIYWLGCFVCLYRLGKSDGDAPKSADWYFTVAVMTAILLSSLITYRFTVGFIATALALYLFTLSRADRELKAAAAVLLALSVHLLWGPIVFQFFTPELLWADAALVGGMLKLLRPDIIWNVTTFQTPGGLSVSLVGACSSFHNVSTALLACVAAAMFARTIWTRQDFKKCTVAIVVMIALNDVRICLLAWNSSSYEFWHNGLGVSLFSIFVTAVLLAISFWGLDFQKCRG